MHRARSVLVTALALTILSSVASVAHAQVGWVELDPHLAGSSSVGFLPVSHTFVQGSNGLVETFTDEFTPGTHTLARVDAIAGDCRASADNVTFTVTAGKWTTVDVPMTLKDCNVNINIIPVGDHNVDGGGKVLFVVNANIGAPITAASCEVVEVNTPPYYAWTNFHACHGVVPYGAQIEATMIHDANSLPNTLGDTAFSQVIDTTDVIDDFTFAFDELHNPHPNGISLHTDLGLTLVGGSVQGFVSNSIFRIVNHGPANAYNVSFGSNDLFSGGNFRYAISSTDGHNGKISFLPAGDSTTVTLRVETLPDPDPDNPSDSFPSVARSCTTATVSSQGSPEDTGPVDPNPSNNSAACVSSVVPVTVALGGSTPPNHTVAAGASDVPMIEFVLTPASQQTVTGVTVQASGTGNEQADVTAVNLYVDKNGNGAVDAGDSLVATGTFAANDGTVTLAVNPGLAITAPTALLVTYSFSVTVAERIGGAIVLAFLPLFFIPATRKRKTVLAMLLVMPVSYTHLTLPTKRIV